MIKQAANGEPVSLMGSSLGGYLAALYASRHPEVQKLVLLAPAFEFNQRWEERLGSEAFEQWRKTGKLPVYHYSDKRDTYLGWQFWQDAQQYPDYPEAPQPTLIFQGTGDTVVLPRYPQEYVRRHPHAQLHVARTLHGRHRTPALAALALVAAALTPSPSGAS